jgi:deoxyribonuclease V
VKPVASPAPGSIVAVDVHYLDEGTARAAAVVFAEWSAAEPSLERVSATGAHADYVPGSFYLRELPCVLPLLSALIAERRIHTVVVDGYVDLGGDRPGLGRHLHEALGGASALVGVAKNPFAGSEATPLVRGSSQKPLFITATGDVDQAVADVARMHGTFRMPTLLRRVDQLARGIVVPQ